MKNILKYSERHIDEICRIGYNISEKYIKVLNIEIGFNYNNGTTSADYYYGIDNWGNINYIYDSTGAVVVTYKYDAWGNAISTTGTLAGTIGAINPYRYKSYYYDAETGLYYLQSRYYDAQVQRFVSPDMPELMGTSSGIYAYNLYAYCENNPVNNKDAHGCLVSPISILGALLGAFNGYYIGTAIANGLNLRGWKRALCIGSVAVLSGALGFLFPKTTIIYSAIKFALSAIGSTYLNASDMPVTKAMYEHAIWGGGKSLSREIVNKTIQTIKRSETFSAALKKNLAGKKYVKNLSY